MTRSAYGRRSGATAVVLASGALLLGAALGLRAASEAWSQPAGRQRGGLIGRPVSTLDTVLKPGEEYTNELFRKYDDDGSGMIDRQEFSAIAEEMQSDAQRRTVFAMLASAVAATVVAEYDNEYQFAQRTFRGAYVDEAAERTMNKYFPTACLSADVVANTGSALAARGFTSDNTLFAHSVCPDEVNTKSEELVYLMSGMWGEAFTLGGLAGIPFAGKSGFGAFLHHTPEKGKVLIMFAPHVGISPDGKVGAVIRFGQSKSSTACGAAVGAYSALKKGGALNSDQAGAAIDTQLNYIVEKLNQRLEGVGATENDMAFVAYQNYDIARQLLFEILDATPDLFNWATEVAVLGGIMINRNQGGDFFQPMLFQTRRKDGTTADIFEQAFGKKPDLAPVLGSSAAASKML